MQKVDILSSFYIDYNKESYTDYNKESITALTGRPLHHYFFDIFCRLRLVSAEYGRHKF